MDKNSKEGLDKGGLTEYTVPMRQADMTHPQQNPTDDNETPVPQMRTTGVIAKKLGQTVARIEYIIRARDIKEWVRAGRLRVYNDEQVEQIRQAIAEIDERLYADKEEDEKTP